MGLVTFKYVCKEMIQQKRYYDKKRSMISTFISTVLSKICWSVWAR